VEVALLFRASARVKSDGPEAGTTHGEIEITNSSRKKLGGGGDISGAVAGLHKNRTESAGTPIRFEKKWLGAIVSSKARAGSHAKFHIFEQLTQRGCPFVDWDGLTVEFLNELTERFEFNFQPWAILVVKIAELNEGMESLAGGWEGPIGDHVEFGLGRTIAVAS
jgi:hypothetical protein